MGVAHNYLDAGAAKLKAARNEAAECNSTWNIDEGVDAEAWAPYDGVDLGAGLETCECQEPGQGRKTTSRVIKSGWTGRTILE